MGLTALLLDDTCRELRTFLIFSKKMTIYTMNIGVVNLNKGVIYMIIKDYVLPVLSLLVSIVSVIIAYKAISISKAAKVISEESNSIAKDANNIASKSLNYQIAPLIELTKLELNPTSVKVYGGKNIAWDGKSDLSDELYQKIKELALSNILTTIDGKEYLLVNLCYSDTPKDDIGLILGAFTFEAESKGTRIAEIYVDRVYSLLNSKEPFMSGMKLDIHQNIAQHKITLTIAYACPYNFPSSLNLANIASLAKNTVGNINLLETPERVAEIIGFMETSYLIRCITADNDEFFYTLYIKRNNFGRMEASQIYRGYEKYKEYYIKATEIACKEIESIAEYNKLEW